MNVFSRKLRSFPIRTVFLFAAVLPIRIFASEQWEINLVGDMYPEGRDLPHPAPGKPIYYYPLVLGYLELGAPQSGDQPPSKREMAHGLATALAAQGYLVTREIAVPAKANALAKPGESSPATLTAFSPPPSLLLVLNWGSLRPQKIDQSMASDVSQGNAPVVGSAAPAAVLNKGEMIGLIAGRKFDSIVDFGMKTDEILQGIEDDRYFIMISAYDFDAYFQHHKKVLLWVAKVSAPSAGVTMAEIMPILINAGGPVFGNETIGPKLLDMPKAPEGKVEVGIPTVVEPPKN
jgi:hypothetical protein